VYALVSSSASAGTAAAAATVGHVHVDTGGTTDQAYGEFAQGIADTANRSSCSLDHNLLLRGSGGSDQTCKICRDNRPFRRAADRCDCKAQTYLGFGDICTSLKQYLKTGL